MSPVRLSSQRLNIPTGTGHVLGVLVLLIGGGVSRAAGLPDGIATHLPSGYEVLGRAAASFGSHAFYIVALGRKAEQATFEAARKGLGAMPESAGPRPLLLFERQPDGSFRKTGRNDHVVMHADQGGQCDPFLDGGNTIAVKGLYFTVQNGVACGEHWTDYVTFRFDEAAGRYVFENERRQSSRLNPSRDPNAEAMVMTVPDVRRSDRAQPIPFADWRPRR